ncbi:hypothetical protein H2200_013175 [Cladophialophora chaetospira]|uniref:Uncharacterized protein n=1 Tax=Cladophialophora chaetospira TaxID=386627 RepID=A0AA38WWA3_9EURO|nr:hypothetical protein H2200_013175 [Cladophialophora chaetospira]
MEWANSLKRTRNGSIYSETVSRLTQLKEHANKRRKTSASKEDAVPASCHLESLPVELLQQIFLTSMNGNLLTASPRVAVKLSGTKAVYRAAFLLAFYSHDINNMFDLYGLHYLVPILDVPLSSWDIRSMTRAVLNSRWCTWGQVKLWLRDNLCCAVEQLLAVAKPSKSHAIDIEKFMRGETRLGSLSGRAWWAEDVEKHSWQLETDMWDVRLERDADVYDDEMAKDVEYEQLFNHDEFTAEWTNELKFQYQMRIFGVLTVDEEKNDYPDHSIRSTDPFRYVVESAAGLNIANMEVQPSSVDFWQLLDERAFRATENAHSLREVLAIQYYLHPEDQPFKISPRLYRAAAIADVNMEENLYEERGSFVPVLYVLFQLDPLSLPRKDAALLAWAARARKRTFDFFWDVSVLRDELAEQKKKRGGVLNNLDRNRYRAKHLEHKFTYEMDWQILAYIDRGHFWKEPPPNPLVPDFREPLAWLGERISPSPKALDDAELLPFPYSSIREVDIFGENPGYDYGSRWKLEEEVMEDLYYFFEQSEEDTKNEAGPSFDRSWSNYARDLLNPSDDYHNLPKNDDYESLLQSLGTIASGARAFEFTDWDGDNDDYDDDDDGSDDDDESEDEHGSGNPPGAFCWDLLENRPLVVHRNLTDLDLAILFPNDFHPIPSKDTELIDPLFGAPKWFHPVDRPYLEELH